MGIGRRWLTASNLLTATLLVGALLALIASVRRFTQTEARASTSVFATRVENVSGLNVRRNLIGPSSAELLLVEYSDFQCPFCVRFAAVLDSVVRQYDGLVAVSYRHFPQSSIHPFAFTAAEAAECASSQNRFRPYHDLVFDLAGSLANTDWVELAARAGVPDRLEFAACLEHRRMSSRVLSDITRARGFGIEGTPALVVGDRIIVGLVTADELTALIDSELDGGIMATVRDWLD